jgi:D-alanine-D-alanine ligase
MGAEEAVRALDPNKYLIIRYDPATDLARLATEAEDIDVALILLHGVGGEDGSIQGFLELLGIPYQGSGILGSAIAMDKNLAKKLYRQHSLPVADWTMANGYDQQECEQVIARLHLPLVVKPVRQGSSLGMSIVRDQKELPAALEKGFRHDNQVMVEEFIQGREITVGVIGNKILEPLPLVEIIPDDHFDFFDYTAKYQKGATTEICPARVSEAIKEKAFRYGIVAHKALQLKGYSRTDMIIDSEDNIIVLETNTIPGMTQTSLLPLAASVHGLDFSALLDRLIELALKESK